MSLIHINTGVTVSSNFPFCMFVCGREGLDGYGCGMQLAYCADEEFALRGE